MRGPQPGGQLVITTNVENYPGFINGILGPKLMRCFEAQAARFETELRLGTITTVDFSQRPFHLTVDREKSLFADTVIIATGAEPRYLGLKNEQQLLGRGISFCATCDGFFFQSLPAAGSGCMAAIDAERWLQTQNRTTVFQVQDLRLARK
nr:FAD-dependent oxidoreductase [Pleurocapsa sp. PCC 7319]